MTAKTQETTFIYALRDPDTTDVCYVGKSNRPKKRLKTHLTTSLRGATPKDLWVTGLVGQGKAPVVEILEEVTHDGWQDCERKWIAYYRQIGAPLTNVDDGGRGGITGHVVSPETRARASERMKALFAKWRAEDEAKAAAMQESIERVSRQMYEDMLDAMLRDARNERVGE